MNYAILYSMMLIVMMTIIQTGLWFYGRDLALSAARSGVDLGRGFDAIDVGAAQAHAQSVATRNGGGVLDSPSATAATSATTMTVTVNAQVLTLVPGLNLTVSQSSTAALEQVAE